MSQKKASEYLSIAQSLSTKIQSHHLERLAIVYIRQSSLQQILNNVESTKLQYSLKYQAEKLGWSSKRILVIDEDLGTSATTVEGRPGFQRLVTEVGLNHVGIILGIEMSRLTRCCKDWYQLLEICALFGTLIADLDGIYNPSNYNDRLLLGLKGTMSEAELHLLKQRLYQGKLNKAKRGEIITALPTGYIKRANGEVSLDPDSQVQTVVRLIFDKFAQYRTINAVLQYIVHHHIQIGMRLRGGINKGELEWRRPSRTTLSNMLHHPIYAGAYTFGRRQADSRHKRASGKAKVKDVVQEKWLVLIKNCFPAYISWQQYMSNQKQLKSNHNKGTQLGAIAKGKSLLSGLVVCLKCQRKMSIRYSSSTNQLAYVCMRQYVDYGEKVCQHLPGKALNQFVTEQVLLVLTPASIELSLRAEVFIEQEGKELDKLFQQKLQRANYEVERAARQYKLVEPENRLVARQLENDWEEKLRLFKQIEEEYNRFKNNQLKILSQEQKQQIKDLASNIPQLWHAKTTTDAERKIIIGQLVEKIEVDVKGDSEKVEVIIHWAGGDYTEQIITKTVARFEQMTKYNELTKMLEELVKRKLNSRQIAEELNKAGFHPPKRSQEFSSATVRQLKARLGLNAVCRSKYSLELLEKLEKDEWWVPQLATYLNMPVETLHRWVYQGWVKSRQLDDCQGRLIVWADQAELQRLRELRNLPKGYWIRKHWFETSS